ncbi:MAG: SDR family NAD(P)-dependent oxidoreductase [Acidimicrobiales bacterium]
MSARVAVVTGAASGIGLGVTHRLAEAGHAVALLDRDGAGAKAAAADLSERGSRAAAYEVDVADRGALEQVFAEVRAQFGPVTILVTSAGIESFDAVADITSEKWDHILAVNLTGTFVCMQLAVPDMVAEGWGRIVTISSSSAQSGAPHMAHYVASKGGVIGLTKAFAREFAAQGITVNTIPPTIVDTPMARHAGEKGDVPSIDVLGAMVPIGRAATPDDIAATSEFLCSEDAGYITGQIIGVNGGMYI